MLLLFKNLFFVILIIGPSSLKNPRFLVCLKRRIDLLKRQHEFGRRDSCSLQEGDDLIVPGGGSEHMQGCRDCQAILYPRSSPLERHHGVAQPQTPHLKGKSHLTFSLFVEVRMIAGVKVDCCRVCRFA